MDITSVKQDISEYHLPSASDYFSLLKPRVMSLVIFTAFIGLLVAPGEIHPVIGFTAILCIAVAAGASGCLNMWYEADIDAKMHRTADRPIPAGRIEAQSALHFGIALSVGSVLVMGLMVNVVAALLLTITILFYVVVYTMWLKRRTAQNIVIGGLAGAMPPLLGWVSMTGELHPNAFLLVMIIFTWTPPHFWALAIHRKDDYARVNIPMLPVTHGLAFTKNAIVLYTILLTLVCFLPYLIAMTGLIYLVSSTILNLVFLKYAWQLKVKDDKNIAMDTFKFSIWHLLILFVALLVDHFYIIRF